LRRSLKWLAVATTIAMILILIGGALVTKTGSGMGCGRSWPLCNGKFLPLEITPELAIELAHRLVSGVGGVMVLVLSFGLGRLLATLEKQSFFPFSHSSFYCYKH